MLDNSDAVVARKGDQVCIPTVRGYGDGKEREREREAFEYS